MEIWRIKRFRIMRKMLILLRYEGLWLKVASPFFQFWPLKLTSYFNLLSFVKPFKIIKLSTHLVNPMRMFIGLAKK